MRRTTHLLLAVAVAAAVTAVPRRAIAAPASPPVAPPVGKPVRIVSLSFKSASLERIAGIIDAEGGRGVDLVSLPETWRGTDVVETLSGPTITTMSQLARRHRTWWRQSPAAPTASQRRAPVALLCDRA